MEELNSNSQIESLLQNNGFQKGHKNMLYRKKKHNEITNSQTNNIITDIITKPNSKEKIPNLSPKQFRPLPKNNTLQNEQNNLKQENNNQQINEENQLDKQIHSEIDNQDESFVNKTNSSQQKDSNHKEHKINIDIKQILEDIEQQLNQYQEDYDTKYCNVLIQKIAVKCKEYLDKNKIRKLNPTIQFDLQIKSNFTKETSKINVHLVVINLLFNIFHQCNEFLEKSKSTFSNLIFIYWIYYFVFQSIATLLKEAKLKLEHYINGVTKRINFVNVKNNQKNIILHQIYDILSGYKEKFLKDKQLNFFVENFFNNAIYEILKTQDIPFLKQVHIINLDSNITTFSCISKNDYYLQNQNDMKEKNKVIKSYIEENKHKLTKAKIDIYKLSQMRELTNTKLSSKIISLNVYYLNTSTLIEEFLSCDE